MSIVIGGAVGAAVGTAVIGTGVSMAAGALAGGSSSSSGTAAAADPFASQRGRYQESLYDLVNASTSTTGGLTAPGVKDLWGLTDTNNNATAVPMPGQTTGGNLMQQMLTPGYEFNSNDASYAWRLQQGAGALTASNAAKGLLNSGSIATALTDYGQNAASQEYQAQFGRASTQDQSQQQLDRTKFSSALALNQDNRAAEQATFDNSRQLNSDTEAAYQNAYGRLSQLSGATSGSPATAAQLASQENASAAAGLHQIVDPLTGAITNSLSSSGTSGTSNSSNYYSSDYGQYF